jgi:hypothetical protein
LILGLSQGVGFPALHINSRTYMKQQKVYATLSCEMLQIIEISWFGACGVCKRNYFFDRNFSERINSDRASLRHILEFRIRS